MTIRGVLSKGVTFEKRPEPVDASNLFPSTRQVHKQQCVQMMSNVLREENHPRLRSTTTQDRRFDSWRIAKSCSQHTSFSQYPLA